MFLLLIFNHFVSQGFASVMLSNLLLGFMGLFAVVVAVGCTQLDKLHSQIMNIKQKEGAPPSDLHNQLTDFIKRHQMILT